MNYSVVTGQFKAERYNWTPKGAMGPKETFISNRKVCVPQTVLCPNAVYTQLGYRSYKSKIELSK